MRLADHRIDIPQRRGLGGDDVNVDPEPVRMKTDRLLHPLRPAEEMFKA